jgi:cobyrinic acid a,c-diamide synthase
VVARLVLAAPASGTGKTTVATGLMAALRRRGLQVSPHKVGPDYIDPGYHALATGRPGRNLDPVMVGEDLVAPLLLHGARGADVAVVEGVMGLYDGRGATDVGSTAHVARLLRAPVVLVVDASSQSRSVAALVHGFRTYDSRVDLAGVVLNRVGSDRHEQLLRESLGDVPVLGVLRRDAGIEVPSRHLGLVPAAERRPEAVAVVERLADLAEASLDLDALLAVARAAPPLDVAPWEPPVVERQERPVVAVLGGPAFTFSYAETTELLTAAGADVVTLDPLQDEALPEGTRGLVVPGGFPEVHAEQLHANAPLLQAVRDHVAQGFATYAECAGLLLLSASLDGTPMVGHFEGVAAMTPRLTLGYRTVTAVEDTLVAAAGTTLTGHEFHRTAVTPPHGRRPAWRLEDGSLEGFTTGGSVVASYVHLHPAGAPDLAGRLVAAAASPLAAVCA